jgi:D-glycero-D-manno-heptose 1,7-bisphosphate phosphatase
MTVRAIFLDRDGVLNDAIIKNGKPYPPASLAELTMPSDVSTALHALKAEGFLLIGATNQPDVARGTTPRATVDAINDHLLSLLPLDEIRACYHDDADQCDCRKPLPGLLTEAAKVHHIDLANSYMIGDRWKDIEAGQLAGCKTIWLRQDYKEQAPNNPADFIAETLTDAVEWIKKNNSRMDNLSITPGLNLKEQQ